MQALVEQHSPSEARLARTTSRALEARSESSTPLRLLDAETNSAVEIPPSATKLLLEILQQMARGVAVKLVPVENEVSTQKAADILNVSRPFLISLLEAGKIQYRKVGKHRRVKLVSLLAYKEDRRAARRAALDELARYDQQLGI